MLNITKELKAKLLAAKSEEEAAALVKANGQEITEEESALLWKEITSKWRILTERLLENTNVETVI